MCNKANTEDLEVLMQMRYIRFVSMCNLWLYTSLVYYVLYASIPFNTMGKDIICKYKLSSYSEQGLQSQEPKHSTKSLAINTSFDPGEW